VHSEGEFDMSLHPCKQSDESIRQKFDWAINIVREEFSRGLEHICDSGFLQARYRHFRNKADPIYTELLNGMQDEALAKTFVSYWTIAHTLATQSRFWLDDAIAKIIIKQAQTHGRFAIEVYSHSMLCQGYLQRRKPVVDIGEQEVEHLSNIRTWRESIQQSALQTIDVLVGEQERERVATRIPFQPRQWNQEANEEAQRRDMRHLQTVGQALKGPPASEVILQCNLLVIEPDKRDGQVHAQAIRYINPKTFASHPTRKQERVNLLRLYALLVQEKILRDPQSIHVRVAELVPRRVDYEHNDHYPDYFSTHTFWPTKTLWEFIGVPFDVVQLALHDVAQEFRKRLKDGLRDLLPKPMSAHQEQSLR
jgi:hypothetical protein